MIGSRYRILEKLGSGGFGVVYAAEDRSLKRKVAIKFLSEAAFRKEHVRARFQREARLAAALNHPNICTVHEVGEAGAGDEMLLDGDPRIPQGTPFLVLELVAGQHLGRILKEEGRLPVQRLLEIAVPVAEGMAEAHGCSIVHRDLKPENIMVTADGRVKILDFGMAKPLFRVHADDNAMRTTDAYSQELSREGMVTGTVLYMSPEQASGKPLDARSDVFSFGIVLYEMATAKRPFEADSVTSTLAKIIETEPAPVGESRQDLPAELSRVIHRCLRKRPQDRYNDTRDLAVALRDLLHESTSGVVARSEATVRPLPAARSRRMLRLALWGTVGAFLLVGLALVVSRLTSPSLRFVPVSFRQITFTGSASHPSLSPDGQSLAYAATRPEGGYRVMIHDVVGEQQLPVFDAAWIRSLRWSPNGSELLVSGSATGEASQIYVVSRLGGSTRPMPYMPFAAWSPDGTRYAGATLSGKEILFTETATGGTSSIELTGAFSFIYELDWSPRGGLLGFRTSDESGGHAIWTTTVDGRRQQVVVQAPDNLYSPRFTPEGDAIYYLEGNERAKSLRRVPVDPRTGERDGEPALLLSGLQAGEHITFSSDGMQLFYPQTVSHTNVWLLELGRDRTTTSQLTRGTFRQRAPRFSPDGSRVALIRESTSFPNLFVMSLADARPVQLTFLAANVWQPVWSPDGTEIAFGSSMGEEPRVWKVNASGGTPQPFENSRLSQDLAWAPGFEILYQRPGNSALHFLNPASGEEKPFLGDLGESAADPLQFFSWMASPEYAPGGGRVAFRCACPDGEGIWVTSLDGSSRTLIHGDRDALPVGWSSDGAWVYALKPEARRILRLSARGGAAEPLVDVPFDTIGDVDVAPDGTRIAVTVPVTQADIWLIENFDPFRH